MSHCHVRFPEARSSQAALRVVCILERVIESAVRKAFELCQLSIPELSWLGMA